MKQNKLAIIGTGNVATHLAHAFLKAEIAVDFVIGTTAQKAEKIASHLGAQPFGKNIDWEKEFVPDTLFILCVQDDKLESVSQAIPAHFITAHTSGGSDLDILTQKKRGVFYPLQTFSKDAAPSDFDQIPMLIEASDTVLTERLLALAQKISSKTQLVNSEQRAQLHLSAVFACNFTNHLYTIAENLLADKDLDLQLLAPLLRQTADKAITLGPQESQTGPAVRGDEKIIEKHLANLEKHPELEQLYHDFTRQIQETHGKKL